MANYLGRRFRFTVLCEVRWCPEDKPARLPNFACRHRRIRQRAHSQCDVDAFLDKVDVSIIELRRRRPAPVLFEKGWQVGHDMKARERDCRAEA
jgi:hypothetical protein